MSGHSKWATIKRKKGAADAKRGQVFTKLIREITVAAKMGGGDINGNARLRAAVSAARGANMPNSNIERAIAKGVGGSDGATYEEITYEGYGPHKVALLVEVLTDNRNRAAAEVRSVFTKRGGTLGETNSVRPLFHHIGHMYVDKSAIDEDTLMMTALDAGAEDIREEDDTYEVVTSISGFHKVQDALEEAGISFDDAAIEWVPIVTVKVTGAAAESVLKMVDILEDLDDVQNVYGNFDIDEEELERLTG